jgi:hypothetical protein
MGHPLGTHYPMGGGCGGIWDPWWVMGMGGGVFCLLWVWVWGGHTRWVCTRCRPANILRGWSNYTVSTTTCTQGTCTSFPHSSTAISDTSQQPKLHVTFLHFCFTFFLFFRYLAPEILKKVSRYIYGHGQQRSMFNHSLMCMYVGAEINCHRVIQIFNDLPNTSWHYYFFK